MYTRIVKREDKGAARNSGVAELARVRARRLAPNSGEFGYLPENFAAPEDKHGDDGDHHQQFDEVNARRSTMPSPGLYYRARILATLAVRAHSPDDVAGLVGD